MVELVRRIRPVLLNERETDVFWACFTDELRLAGELLRAHPTLTVYTISSWGEENWVHRGIRTVDRFGILLGTVDLGEGYAEHLWNDDPL